jgi:hypothetical protein
MFWLTEASVSCNNLSAVVTCKHVNSVLSSTHLQSIGRGGKLEEPSRRSPDTPRPTALKGPRAGAASSGAAPPVHRSLLHASPSPATSP